MPPDRHWGNFLEAFKVANMSALLTSSVFIVVGLSVCYNITMAGLIGLLRMERLLLIVVFGLTLRSRIIPLYFWSDRLGYSTPHASCWLIGLFMPFAVFWMRATSSTCRRRSRRRLGSMAQHLDLFCGSRR